VKKKNMRKLLLIFTAFLVINICDIKAQNPIDSTLLGAALITQLRANYTPNQTLGYGPGRDIMYSIVDNDGNNGVHGIYTDFVVYWTPGTDPSSNIYQGGSGINAEHIFPQSKGAGSEPAKSDMFNLRPSRTDVNSARANCPFGEIPDANTDNWYREAVSQSNTPGSNIDEWSESDNDSGCFFEPRESVKGNIARSVFYFFTIYTNADANFFNGMKEILLTWHYQDPVDSAELNRNMMVQSYQGNDNPFILDSTLARRAYFPQYAVTSTDRLETAEEEGIVIYPNPFSDKLSFTEPVDFVSITDAQGRLVLEYKSEKQSISELDVSDFSKGVYWIRYNIGTVIGHKTIIKQ
jgi:endonuclease I